MKTLLAVAAALALAGCTHVSNNISDEGVAGEVIFPAADKVVLKEGTFPTIEALRQVGPGVTKDQLYQLLGRPHFNEGLVGVREWDYLFHFRDGNEVTTCQYKVIFDKDYHGQSFHWLPAECGDRLASTTTGTGKTMTISADTLFRFAGGSEADLLPEGRQQLEEVAVQLKKMQAGGVIVVGHTDRIGSEVDNLRLSQQRADTVRQFLAARGIAADNIIAVGKGEADPISHGCVGNDEDEAVRQCLQPDRRVDVIAQGIG
ncbi:OmpA family protein [Pseudoxanthomonas dokdonensis]|nr:OmpA family protein [Pseudoxanthomonas dokdonensis]